MILRPDCFAPKESGVKVLFWIWAKHVLQAAAGLKMPKQAIRYN